MHQELFAGAVHVGPRSLVQRLQAAEGKPRFSICTLLTNIPQYKACIESYRRNGFDATCSELLVIDNSRGNQADAYVGLNELLQAAQGDYVILTHQDVLLLEDGRPQLEARLDELTRLDPHWGLCGNAGYNRNNKPVLFLSHPVSEHHVEGGPFPAAVVSLDENFIVVRKSANLALSRDLKGFHHYGADLCIVADILGWNAYVIAFKLRHESGGTVDKSYVHSGSAITRKYARALRSRWINLITERPIYISGSAVTATRARAIRSCADAVRYLRFLGGTARNRLLGQAGRRR